MGSGRRGKESRKLLACAHSRTVVSLLLLLGLLSQASVLGQVRPASHHWELKENRHGIGAVVVARLENLQNL